MWGAGGMWLVGGIVVVGEPTLRIPAFFSKFATCESELSEMGLLLARHDKTSCLLRSIMNVDW